MNLNPLIQLGPEDLSKVVHKLLDSDSDSDTIYFIQYIYIITFAVL